MFYCENGIRQLQPELVPVLLTVSMNETGEKKKKLARTQAPWPPARIYTSCSGKTWIYL